MSKKKKNIELIVPTDGALSTEVVIEKQMKLSRTDIIDLAYNEKLRSLENNLKIAEDEKEKMKHELNDVVKNIVLETLQTLTATLKNAKVSFSAEEWRKGSWMLEGFYSAQSIQLRGDYESTPGLKEKVEPLVKKYKELCEEARSTYSTINDMTNNQSKFKAEMIRKILLETESGRSIIESIKKISF